MRKGCMLLIAAGAVGCGAPDPAPPAAADASSAEPGAVVDLPAADSAMDATVIGPEGIGVAQAGMSVAEIRSALGERLRLGEFDGRFMVDLNAMPVLRGEDALYYLVFPAEETPNDESVPMLAITDHREVRTEEGIGPGSTLAEAAATYGSPTLRFSAEDEMREYATFPRYSHATVAFRVAPGDTVFLAGRYESDRGGQTAEFDPGARIMMVLVRLRRF